MTDSPSTVNLARLDDVQTITPDPRIFSANLSALRTRQPQLAAQLEQVKLPPDWRAVVALDGRTTFRTEASGEPAAWLADTATPGARADGLLAGVTAGDHNPSLPSIAAGAELRLLLARLPYYQAVYVFETELTALAAVLRIADLASEMAAGRCVLVPPRREEAFLREYLTTYPGLLHPANIVVLPGVAPERIGELRRICERVARDILQARSHRLSELRAAATASPAATATAEPRLAVVALTPNRVNCVVGKALHGAARALGWPSACCCIDGPADAHVLPHCENLADLAPNLTICVGHSAAGVPLPLQGTVCEWVTRATDVPAQIPADGVLRLGASPRVADALRVAAPADGRVAEWYWACDLPEQGDAPQDAEDVVLLVADWPNDDPAACGIEQPTHQHLWQHLQQAAAEAWERREVLRPAGLLASAERATGIHLGEASLRPWLLRLIESTLIPAAIVGTIARALASEPIRVQAVGRGWSSQTGKEIETSAEHVFELPDRGPRLRPRAAIFAGSIDPLTPALLHAGALGWPLLIHSPGSLQLTASLGHILHPQQHFLPFSGRSELRTLLRSARQDPEPAQRRAARTRQHLRDNHSYGRRLEQLVELIADVAS